MDILYTVFQRVMMMQRGGNKSYTGDGETAGTVWLREGKIQGGSYQVYKLLIRRVKKM